MQLRQLTTSCLLFSAIVSPATLVQAQQPAIVSPATLVQAEQSSVRSVLASQAQGQNGPIVTVTVWLGSGTNLNFIPTGEIIKKVWLDDLSQIVFDSDGPMCMATGDRRGDNCEQSAATVLHLRRIHPLEFPNLPRTATTLLSVITQSPTSERKLYQFRISYGKGQPQYHTVRIEPDAQTKPIIETGGLFQARLQEIERGLEVAKSRRLLAQSQGNQKLERRVQNYLALVRNGSSPESAAKEAGVSMVLISKLIELGTTSKEPVASLSSVKPILLPEQILTLSSPLEQSSVLPTNTGQRLTQTNPTVVSSDDLSYLLSVRQEPQLKSFLETITAPVNPISPVVFSEQPTGRAKPASDSRDISKQNSTTQPSSLAVSTTPSTKYPQSIQDANAVRVGLTVARSKKQINFGTTKWKQAQSAIRWLLRGNSREEAARLAQLPLNELNQLIKWGQNRP